MLNLAHNLEFYDLYNNEGLKKIDNLWLQYLEDTNLGLYNSLNLARSSLIDYESQLIIELAPYTEDFIAKLFNIENEVEDLCKIYNGFAKIYKCKRLFIQRVAVKNFKDEDILNVDEARTYLNNLGIDLTSELSFAEFIDIAQFDNNTLHLEHARIYAGWATLTQEGKKVHRDGILFKLPRKLDFNNLLPDLNNINGRWSSDNHHSRDGFSITDLGISKLYAYDQANYCIHCHPQNKDSCSHGMKNSDSSFKINDLEVTLTGCPLGEKISEMNLLKSQGSVLGAFATAIIDNPMLAATGHRICNDCMKSCIYQKQEPVNIPAIETKILDDVLSLPFGFEIYSLLTRWNPLNFQRPLPKDASDYKILIAGLGPAGFTAAHHLLNEGFSVVAIDGLKIEPLQENICGIDQHGNRKDFKPIFDIKKEVFQDLNERVPQGFGGVAEYGITVRWNKNYLNVIRLLLERRSNFKMYGGIRFGSTINYRQAQHLGFDHIVLALGAGKPNLLNIPNTLARGCRMASDFLMSLQQGGAFLANSLTNLQVRMPIVVIGGGLTAIDTATESLEYYSVQVEKFLKQYEIVGVTLFDALNEEEKIIANEFLVHANLLRNHPDKKSELLKLWGGSKVLYRKTLQESPAYRLNHEEVELALNEGIEFIENIIPVEVLMDEFGSAKTLVHLGGQIDAKTILIATGTEPNTILASEDPDNFMMRGRYFLAVDSNGEPLNHDPEAISKPKSVDIMLNNGEKGGLSVSFLGDLHPSFKGNVVKAMASAKAAYPIISSLLKSKMVKNKDVAHVFFKQLDNLFNASVVEVKLLTPTIEEVIIHAPLAAQNFKPGQFYKLQNYNAHASQSLGQKMAIEGIALTGASVDKTKGHISLIVLNIGASSLMCRDLKPNEPIIIMGPTGEPTYIPKNKVVMLVGGGLGNAVLFSIGKSLKDNGCKVLYFAGYRKVIDRFKQNEIERSADSIVWCCDEEILSSNSVDYSFKGNIIEGIEQYSKQINVDIKLQDVEHMIVIGSDQMMKAVAYARHNQFKKIFKSNHIAIGSINSPMQCMMKEICGQCIQRHVDPVSNVESYVYSCTNQDQLLDSVDFKHLHSRLKQNSLQEKMCNQLLAKINDGDRL